MARQPGFIGARRSTGAILEPVYGTRQVRHVAVSENELEQLSTLGALSTFFVSLAVGLLFFALGNLASAFLIADVGATPLAFARFAFFGGIVLGLIMFVGASIAMRSRASQVRRIRQESEA